MKKLALEKLDDIRAYPFFAAVGKPMPELTATAQDWSSALETALSRKWENCRVQARNALQLKLEDASCWDRLEAWDDIVTSLNPGIEAHVSAIMPKLPLPEEKAIRLKPQLAWDILFCCMEHEFSDVVKPMFFLPQLDQWYSRGHFPCGWDGEQFPDGWDGIIRNGRLIVF